MKRQSVRSGSKSSRGRRGGEHSRSSNESSRGSSQKKPKIGFLQGDDQPRKYRIFEEILQVNEHTPLDRSDPAFAFLSANFKIPLQGCRHGVEEAVELSFSDLPSVPPLPAREDPRQGQALDVAALVQNSVVRLSLLASSRLASPTADVRHERRSRSLDLVEEDSDSSSSSDTSSEESSHGRASYDTPLHANATILSWPWYGRESLTTLATTLMPFINDDDEEEGLSSSLALNRDTDSDDVLSPDCFLVTNKHVVRVMDGTSTMLIHWKSGLPFEEAHRILPSPLSSPLFPLVSTRILSAAKLINGIIDYKEEQEEEEEEEGEAEEEEEEMKVLYSIVTVIRKVGELVEDEKRMRQHKGNQKTSDCWVTYPVPQTDLVIIRIPQRLCPRVSKGMLIPSPEEEEEEEHEKTVLICGFYPALTTTAMTLQWASLAEVSFKQLQTRFPSAPLSIDAFADEWIRLFGVGADHCLRSVLDLSKLVLTVQGLESERCRPDFEEMLDVQAAYSKALHEIFELQERLFNLRTQFVQSSDLVSTRTHPIVLKVLDPFLETSLRLKRLLTSHSQRCCTEGEEFCPHLERFYSTNDSIERQSHHSSELYAAIDKARRGLQDLLFTTVNSQLSMEFAYSFQEDYRPVFSEGVVVGTSGRNEKTGVAFEIDCVCWEGVSGSPVVVVSQDPSCLLSPQCAGIVGKMSSKPQTLCETVVLSVSFRSFLHVYRTVIKPHVDCVLEGIENETPIVLAMKKALASRRFRRARFHAE